MAHFETADNFPSAGDNDPRRDRHRLFYETPRERLERCAAALAYLIKRKSVREIGALGWATARFGLSAGFSAADMPPRRLGTGLFHGIARVPNAATIMAAAQEGFYPQAHLGPLKWLSPNMRAVMMLDAVHFPKRFRRTLRTTDLQVSFDRAFERVLVGCAGRRGPVRLTWLTPRLMHLYAELSDQGLAHSVEVWDAEGHLVGGLFGATVGPVFSALSMFHTADNASKIGIASLYHHLSRWGFVAVDHQIMSPWVKTLGGTLIPHDAYRLMLDGEVPERARPSRWTFEIPTRETAEWRQAEGSRREGATGELGIPA